MSPIIVNKMIKLMGNALLSKILRWINESTPWYAIMADETADITYKEQLSLSICFLVSGATEQTSQALQFQNTTVSEALEAVKMAKDCYRSRELT